ncbi:hypothetical protein N0V93_008676 [Gnomoniopsis smithogilvyi]|uniref:DNA 3'-5' helicase n=1 Tax=Gnomoniopsis smithogilvyi TaxID=1191159 RepID=A0A9W8YNN7_9PEZI|nr:hypothetical protein N0V93_008676 [Gnomoniopsis smithogilvyi]
MWLRRVTVAGSLRARVAPRVFTAALSTSHCVAQVLATPPTSSERRELDREQQIPYPQAALEADLKVARHLLRDKFGIDSISPAQDTLLRRLLAGEDVLLQMVPNNIRSAFQLIPGLVQGGLTILIVTSSLVATNLANSWRNMGIRAAQLDLKTYQSLQSMEGEDILQCNELDVLLLNATYSCPKIIRLLSNPRPRVAVLAIDEADRASKLSYSHGRFFAEWLDLRKVLKPRSFVCATFSRRAEIIDDIQRIFKLPASSRIAIRRTLRSNLAINVITLQRNHDKFATLLDLLEKHPGPTVIVTATIANTKVITAKLRGHGFDAKAVAFDKNTPRRELIDPELFNASSPILCVDKANAKHIYQPNIRHVIWHCLAASPLQFHNVNDIAGRDGATSRCTVLLSEQEIFNGYGVNVAITASLQHMRRFIANIYHGREEFKAGHTFLVEISRLRLLSDLTKDEFLATMDFLRDEKVLHVQRSWQTWIALASRLEPDYMEEGSHPAEFDILNAVEETTGSRLNERSSPFEAQIDAFIASGLLRTVVASTQKSDNRVFYVIRPEKDANVSPSDIESLAKKCTAMLRSRGDERVAARRQYINLFTTKRCFLASLAQAVDFDMPPGWKYCGRCLFCVTHKPAVISPLSQIEKPVDMKRLDAVIRAVPAKYANDPRFLTRVALGVLSTRVLAFELDQNHRIFGSMRRNRFEDVLQAFAKRVGIPKSQWHEC